MDPRQERESAMPPLLALPGWEAIEGLPAPQVIPAGRILQQSDSPVRTVYLIRRGVVKLKCLGPNGRDMIVGLRSSGWMIGCDSAFAGTPALTTAVTINQCEVAPIPVNEFLRGIASGGALNHHFVWNLCSGIEAYLSAHIELRTEPAQQRLEHFLSDMQNLAVATGGARPALSQVEMAQLLSITPEHLCRILGRKRGGASRREERVRMTAASSGGSAS